MKTKLHLLIVTAAFAFLAACTNTSSNNPKGGPTNQGRTRGDFNSNDAMPSGR